MKGFLRANSLSLFFFALLATSLIGQSFAGQHEYNAEQLAHDSPPVSWWRYVSSPAFWGAVMENWQSEFLQFSLFIIATVWLVQRGSNESKPPENAGLESDQMQRIGGFAPPQGPKWAKCAAGARSSTRTRSSL